LTEEQVEEAIKVIKQYMKEHNLNSHQFKGHADVFINELINYMDLVKERKTNA